MRNTEKLIRAVSYYRYSSDKQRSESIDAQRRAVREFCERNGYILVNEYVDEAFSATTDDRPAFLQMIEDSAKDEFEAVIVHKLDRFARNKYDSAIYKRELKYNGVKVISVLELMDDSPESIILESVLEGMAEYYSANLSREVKKGQRENALKGLWNGGMPPLGYIVVDRKLQVEPHEAKIVKSIFEMYASGMSLQDICDHFNSRGETTKTGKPFRKTSIYEILRNEKYLGKYIYRKTKLVKTKTGSKYVLQPDGNVIIQECPEMRIIDEELWQKAQSRINDRSYVSNQAKVIYLLSGKIKCGECGAAYVGNGRRILKTTNKPYYMYMCSGRKNKAGCYNRTLSKNLIEEQIKKLLKKEIFRESRIRKAAIAAEKWYKETHADRLRELARLRNSLTNLKTYRDRLLDMVVNNIITKEEAAKKLKDNSKKIEQTASEISIKEKFTGFDRHDIEAFLLEYKKMFDRASENDLKEIFRIFVNKVIVNSDETVVVLNVYPFMNDDPDNGPNDPDDGTPRTKKPLPMCRGLTGGDDTQWTLSLHKICVIRKNMRVRNNSQEKNKPTPLA